MSTNMEDAIQEKVRGLPAEQQKQVLEFVENLQQNPRREEPKTFASSDMENGNKAEVDLRNHGITPEQAVELQARLSTFEDWNDPEMDVYDDYDQVLATLNQNS